MQKQVFSITVDLFFYVQLLIDKLRKLKIEKITNVYLKSEKLSNKKDERKNENLSAKNK